jgi:hypothetical protein
MRTRQLHQSRRIAVVLLLTVAASASASNASHTMALTDTSRRAVGAASRAPGDARVSHRAIEVWAGMSGASSQWGKLGDMPNGRLALTALRFTQQVRARQQTSVEYGVDVIPMAIASPSDVDNETRITARGVGVNPISVTSVFRTHRAVQLRAGATAGALWFDEAVPITTATHFNLTGSLELGAQVVGAGGSGMVLLYRFHHLSNAGLGAENPGMASHIISLGARWRLGRSVR